MARHEPVTADYRTSSSPSSVPAEPVGLVIASPLRHRGVLDDLGNGDRSVTGVTTPPPSYHDRRRAGQPPSARQRHRGRVRPSTPASSPGVAFISAPAAAAATPSARRRTSVGQRLRLRDRRQGPHRHQRPRGRGREPVHASASARTATPIPAKLVGKDPSTRPRRARRSTRRKVPGETQAARARRARARSRPGDAAIAIGSPFGLVGHRDHRHRLRARPRDRGAQRLPDLRRGADRRRDQPRQLGRPAARRAAAA